MDLQDGFIAAMENEKLIYGVLKRLHIYITNDNYQDFFQEALIIYAESYVEYQRKNQPMDKFNVYIFQKLVWRLTDLLRKEQTFFNVHSLEVFDFDRVEQEESDEMLSEINLDNLTEPEKRLFFDCFIEKIPLVKLSAKYHCSARNLRYKRNSLREKLCKMLS